MVLPPKTTRVTVEEPWLPATIGFACTEDCRSPEHLVRALAQFEVQCNHRYDRDHPVAGDTHCNAFVWDATSALGCEVPHWIGPGGRSVQPFAAGAHELSAAGQISWLRAFGHDHGWEEITRPEANRRAARGFPVVVSWANPGMTSDGRSLPSHVAMVLPPLRPDEVRIAAAGARNLWDAPLEASFGDAHPLQWWTHD